jgi:hypothetical protein
MKNPPCQSAWRVSENLSGKLYSSLAVFYVEQVALNRHVSPQPQLLFLCLKTQEMSRGKGKRVRYAPDVWENMSQQFRGLQRLRGKGNHGERVRSNISRLTHQPGQAGHPAIGTVSVLGALLAGRNRAESAVLYFTGGRDVFLRTKEE